MLYSIDKDVPEICCSCGTKTKLADLHKASHCEYFVCSACATYHKQPWTVGYLCEDCYSKSKMSSKQKDYAA